MWDHGVILSQECHLALPDRCSLGGVLWAAECAGGTPVWKPCGVCARCKCWRSQTLQIGIGRIKDFLPAWVSFYETLTIWVLSIIWWSILWAIPKPRGKLLFPRPIFELAAKVLSSMPQQLRCHWLGTVWTASGGDAQGPCSEGWVGSWVQGVMRLRH